MRSGALASVDVGTNTLRMRIEAPGRPAIVERRITRLGRGIVPAGGGRLAPEAAERSLGALREFAAVLERERVGAIGAVGTHVLRVAADASDFIDRVRRETGIAIRPISGEEEARLMALGVASAVRDRASPCIVFDIGGGSTEFVRVSEERGKGAMGPRIENAASLPVGSVRLTEASLHTDPPAPSEITEMEGAVRAALTRLPGRMGWAGSARPATRGETAAAPCYASSLIGTAGTVTTLAAMHLGLETYDPDRITGTKLARADLVSLYERLARLPALERLALPGLEKGREDVIVAGAALAIGILDAFAEPSLTASDGGILEGILIEMREGRWPGGPGPVHDGAPRG